VTNFLSKVYIEKSIDYATAKCKCLKKIDIFSLGLVFYMEHSILNSGTDLDNEFYTLVQKMIHGDPFKRISINKVVTKLEKLNNKLLINSTPMTNI
jgi:hypothetical protein